MVIIARDSSNVAKLLLVNADNYLDVKTHTPENCFNAEYTSDQSAATIITPTSGKKIRIISVYASTDDNATDIELTFGTSGDIFFKLYTNLVGSAAGNQICATGATNEVIKISCGANTFVSIGYDEVS